MTANVAAPIVNSIAPAMPAIDIFRTPDPADTPDSHRRTPGQVTADAFVQMCRTALEADATGTTAGSRPHIVVTIDYQTLLREQGVADIERVGPVPFIEVRRLLADAGVARLLTDPDGIPMEAGRRVRTVPAGLRRAIMLRDQQCVAQDCTIPARWCQVAHLATPFRRDGTLKMRNAALMCHYHHRRYDLQSWQITWNNDHPTLKPPRRADTTDPPIDVMSSASAAGNAASQMASSQHMASSEVAGSKVVQHEMAYEPGHARGGEPGSGPSPPAEQLPLLAKEQAGEWRIMPRGDLSPPLHRDRRDLYITAPSSRSGHRGSRRWPRPARR